MKKKIQVFVLYSTRLPLEPSMEQKLNLGTKDV
jgi:hypothetical protein